MKIRDCMRNGEHLICIPVSEYKKVLVALEFMDRSMKY